MFHYGLWKIKIDAIQNNPISSEDAASANRDMRLRDVVFLGIHCATQTRA